jgi:hypothetical protein
MLVYFMDIKRKLDKSISAYLEELQMPLHKYSPEKQTKRKNINN